MKKLLLLWIVLMSCGLYAQDPLGTRSSENATTCVPDATAGDLVRNGNFEQFSQVPSSISQIERACGWASPTAGTPDYYHRDATSSSVRIPENMAGSQDVNPTAGGDAYGGIFFTGGAREIMRTQLDAPLAPNTEYRLVFDVSRSDNRTNQIKFQAYLGSFFQFPPGVGELPIEDDANGILLENDVFSNNTAGWDTISFTFTTGAIAGQEYLYLGTISNVEVLNNGIGAYYIDNVSLRLADEPPCEVCNTTPFVAFEVDENCKYSFLALIESPDCVVDIAYNWSFSNGESSTAVFPMLSPTENGDFTVDLTITYTLPDGSQCEVSSATTTFEVSCVEVAECPSCPEALSEVIDAIIPGPVACGSYVFPLQNALDECYDITVNPGDGSDPFLLEGNAINIHNYTENGTYTAVVIASDGVNTCRRRVQLTVDCFDDKCPDCPDAAAEIINAIIPGPSACGSFVFPFQEELDECYDVFVNPGDGSAPFQLASNAINIHNYTENGTYTVLLTLTDGLNRCQEKVELTVDCFDEKCPTCPEAATEIIDAIIPGPSACGSFVFPFQEALDECYDVFVNPGDGSAPFQLASNAINIHNYTENGTYTVLLTLTDGLNRCQEKVELTVDCFVDECPSCDEILTEVIDLIIPSPSNCPSYIFPLPADLDECASVFVNPGDGSGSFQLQSNALNVHTYTENGVYTAFITVSDDTGRCQKKVELNVNCLRPSSESKLITDPSELEKRNTIGYTSVKAIIYPNPFSSSIQIKNNKDVAIKSVEIYSFNGQLLVKKDYRSGGNIAIPEGIRGVYFAKVYFEDGTKETISLLKE